MGADAPRDRLRKASRESSGLTPRCFSRPIGGRRSQTSSEAEHERGHGRTASHERYWLPRPRVCAVRLTLRARKSAKPGAGLTQGCCVKFVKAVLSVFTNRHESGVTQHFELLRNGRLGHVRFGHDLRHAHLRSGGRSVEEQSQNRPPRFITQHIEDVSHAHKASAPSTIAPGATMSIWHRGR